MAAVDARHPALAEHERVTDRLDVIWYQVLVIFTVDEYVAEYAEAVLSTPSTWVAHETGPVGRISVYTISSATPDKAQKRLSRSRTWNNRTTQRQHHDKGEQGGPDIESLRTLAIQKRVLRGPPRQTGRFRCKIARSMSACGSCLTFSDRYIRRGKTQQDT